MTVNTVHALSDNQLLVASFSGSGAGKEADDVQVPFIRTLLSSDGRNKPPCVLIPTLVSNGRNKLLCFLSTSPFIVL